MELEEIQAKEILSEIVALKQKIVNSQIDAHLEKCCFLAFWDFDGTVMKGDCSEGLRENGEEVFKGLVELGILKGYAREFRLREEFSGLKFLSEVLVLRIKPAGSSTETRGETNATSLLLIYETS